jgi:hypothetical protein
MEPGWRSNGLRATLRGTQREGVRPVSARLPRRTWLRTDLGLCNDHWVYEKLLRACVRRLRGQYKKQ